MRLRRNADGLGELDRQRGFSRLRCCGRDVFTFALGEEVEGDGGREILDGDEFGAF